MSLSKKYICFKILIITDNLVIFFFLNKGKKMLLSKTYIRF